MSGHYYLNQTVVFPFQQGCILPLLHSLTHYTTLHFPITLYDVTAAISIGGSGNVLIDCQPSQPTNESASSFPAFQFSLDHLFRDSIYLQDVNFVGCSVGVAVDVNETSPLVPSTSSDDVTAPTIAQRRAAKRGNVEFCNCVGSCMYFSFKIEISLC